MIDITWDTPETSGHSRKASTIHGWVTKMRGTLVDDERIRKQGIREMEHARRIREWKKEKGIEEQNNLLFSFVPKKPPQPNNQPSPAHSEGLLSSEWSSAQRCDAFGDDLSAERPAGQGRNAG
ncbi:uncharacterized protein C8Q71DRAFT_719701 [Rhodofomes roseus]|uniref:Uncharacterized protein n=1 Tax=Rhodofomes roseus TaxID=34475 RepID=A0ABQ8KXR3_9APHY|nr:uncharacterized protein C8Q71DRAFT_719701 [Rhodofomes roseus]KAH9844097.1 hypothetical protein C8Q71DRAFT_719701 [Rhodofomes roseus]